MSDTAIKKLEGTMYTGMGVLVGPNTFVEGVPLGIGVRYRSDESGYFELSGELQGVIGHPSHYSQRGITSLLGANAKYVAENAFIDGLDTGLGLSLRSNGEKLVASMVSFDLYMSGACFQFGLGSIESSKDWHSDFGGEMRDLFHF